MASREVLKARLEMKKTQLTAAYEAYTGLLQGNAKSYTIGSRSVTKLDLPQLEKTISALEKEVDELEAVVNGGRRQRAVGVIPRDI